MKILKVIHGYPPTYNAGSEVYSQMVCETLSANHEVHVFSREQNEYQLDFKTRKEIRNGIPITLVNLAREKDGYEHPEVNKIFRELLLDFNPDIVHIGHLNHLSLGIVKEIKSANIPAVFTLHDFWLMCPRGQFLQRNFDGKNLYQLCSGQENRRCAINCYKMIHSCRPEDEAEDIAYWESWVARRMNAVKELVPLIDLFIAPSRYLRNRFLNDFKFSEAQILYLDYGFITKKLHFVRSKITRPVTFGYIGTHIPAKGINLLIEAFGKLEGNACLKVWGRPIGQNTEALQRMIKKCKNTVEFKGEYKNENIVQEVFRQTDVIVVPSIWVENSPLVIHEAQACKIPVITADIGGMEEYVKHQVNGLLFRHRDTEDLTTQMQYAIKYPEVMEKLGQRGYLYNGDGHVPNMKNHCEKLLQIYKQAKIKYEKARPTVEDNY